MDISAQNLKKYSVFTTFLLLFCMTGFKCAYAQHSDYEQLAFQKNRPQIHFTFFTLPAENDDRLKLVTTFQLSNNFLPFKKMNNPTGEDKFFSTSGLNLEVFKSPKKIKESPKDGRWRFKQVNVEGLQSVGRDTWQDTAYAATYEQTKSDTTGLNGTMQVEVTPGYYTYLVQMNEDKQPDVPDPERERGHFNAPTSQTRSILVSPYNEQRHNNTFLIKKVNDSGNPTHLDLINMGQDVTYAKDFYAFIHLPGAVENKTYSLQITRIQPSEKDTTKIEQVFNQKITSDQILQNIRPRLESNSNGVALSLQKQNGGYNYALVKIPNKNFPNAVYRLIVKDEDSPRPVAEDIFRSYWSDIPTSLLSLDVATDMLHFITDKDTIRKIDNGSKEEREQKFRAFWKAKDPTPDTEFNELEAEYYRRIDYAYKNFGSEDEAGYNSDQGKVYINFGPPQDIKRTFPTDGATTEIWTYKNRTFVFKATSGFGDFKLVSQK